MSVNFKDGYANVGWFKKQWPWWTAGLMTGTAEIINFLFVPLGHPSHKMIGVTTGMARMLAGAESTLFGHSLIATRPDYQPSIQWVIIGAMIAAFTLGWLEGEHRSWVKYPKAMLISTAFGAFFFAWGTRVDGGCTLHHLLGGFAAMNLKSWVVMFFATVGAFVGFGVLRALNLSQYFRSQDTKWYTTQAQKLGWADGLTVEDNDPPGNWLRIALYAFMIILGIIVIYMAFFGNSYAIKMGWATTLAKTKMRGVMINGANIGNILLLLVVGGLLGSAVAKTGFGTECGLINPELGTLAEKGERKGAEILRMPYSIRTVFLSFQPFAALAVHIVIFGTVMLLAFAFSGVMEGHQWATKAFAANYVAATGVHFHHTGVAALGTMTSLPMDIFGGFLLGLGTFLMIGCEFRNYGRTGLLYITGLLIWPFFYIGYLPYTLNRSFWRGLQLNHAYSSTTFFPALVAPDSKGLQVLIYAVYLLLWAAAFVWAVRRGAKNIGVAPTKLLTMNSEAMYLARLEKLDAEGKLDELDEIERELYRDAKAARPVKGRSVLEPGGAAGE